MAIEGMLVRRRDVETRHKRVLAELQQLADTQDAKVREIISGATRYLLVVKCRPHRRRSLLFGTGRSHFSNPPTAHTLSLT